MRKGEGGASCSPQSKGPDGIGRPPSQPAHATTTKVRLVQHEDIAWFEAKGWTVTDDLSGTAHGEYSVLMSREK